ncbi:MAG: cysteine desulfurase [Acidimicrobiia bacterium]|nr:cysteine desulfurase [Acidimicrobiia bacterium]
MIYLDHAATTSLRESARSVMVDAFAGPPGNPSGQHAAARSAKYALEEVREQFADLIGVRPNQVIFTGGGSEADNLAILGTTRGWTERKRVLVSAGEHKAVLSSADLAIAELHRRADLDPLPSGKGVAVSAARPVETASAPKAERIPLTSAGAVDLDALRTLLGSVAPADPVGLVAVMAVNNETGVIQPLQAVGQMLGGQWPDAVLFVDAVQAGPWLDLGPIAAVADLVAVSAHKFGGPQGVGALIANDPRRLRPLVVGGGQEWGARSGTHNVAGIEAMVAALIETTAARREESARVIQLADSFREQLRARQPNAIWNTDPATTVPGIIHLRLPGLESETVLAMLDEAGVCAAAGSSCQSGAIEPSHVLLAMGMSDHEANSSIRLSLGWTTTQADIDGGVAALDSVIARLGGLTAQAASDVERGRT